MVDIIIPIYNAARDLELCLDSIHKHTDLTNNRLILIDDNSTDSNIRTILDKECGDNIIVIHNSKNVGFSANINIGISQSDSNDVLLLNSDTVVTKNWIEKIVKCAYLDEKTGMVSPLSNNATICSVPDFCSENKLPQGMNVDEVGAILEKYSMRKYPVIPVCHGFCMFIKRSVINEIGSFDADTFGKGYGEENDFCFRAEQCGYQSVLCDDTYIFHSGTKSFLSEEKRKNNEEHDKILKQRYPRGMYAISKYLTYEPNDDICENANIFLDIHKKPIVSLLDGSENVDTYDLAKVNLCEILNKEDNIICKVTADGGNYYWKFKRGELNRVLYEEKQNCDIGLCIEKIVGSKDDSQVIDAKYLFSKYVKRECGSKSYKGYRHDKLVKMDDEKRSTYLGNYIKNIFYRTTNPVKNFLWMTRKKLTMRSI